MKYTLATFFSLIVMLGASNALAFSVSVDPLVQSADCTTSTHLVVGNLADDANKIIAFAPDDSGYWMPPYTGPQDLTDTFLNVMGGFDCGVYQQYGVWEVMEVTDTDSPCGDGVGGPSACYAQRVGSSQFITISAPVVSGGAMTASASGGVVTSGLSDFGLALIVILGAVVLLAVGFLVFRIGWQKAKGSYR